VSGAAALVIAGHGVRVRWIDDPLEHEPLG
jgi:hypothetical protein